MANTVSGFRVVDQTASQPEPSSPAPASPAFQVADPNELDLHFDRAAVEDLKHLSQQLKGDPEPSRIVATALQMLALAVDYDLSVDSRNKKGEKRIFGMWAP